MSTLGDSIIDHGPYSQDLLFGAGFSSDLRWVRAVDLTALRDELIELRAAASQPPAQCQAETRSWDHFTPEQVDSYWIRCTLAVPHDEHKDEHTGLTWVSQAEPDTGSQPSPSREEIIGRARIEHDRVCKCRSEVRDVVPQDGRRDPGPHDYRDESVGR